MLKYLCYDVNGDFCIEDFPTVEMEVIGCMEEEDLKELFGIMKETKDDEDTD